MELRNALTKIEYDPDDVFIFTGSDYTDIMNEPRFLSRNRRGHKKAWEALSEQFTDNTSMYDAITILMDNGMSIHSYCGMD
jgi:hypothetical protein